jgi:large subunit ribosomal protein L4
MQVPVYSLNGDIVKQIEVSERVFGEPFRGAVVHQAVVRQLANARQGTASTKERGEVAGSTRKLYRQKHTGYARAGARRSPLRRGGGITFGPKPRSYRQAMPREMRRLALRCLLSAKAKDGELKVIEELKLDTPKTKEMERILVGLGLTSALVVTAEPEAAVVMASKNLPLVKTLPAPIINVVDLISYPALLMTEAAVRKVEALWGEGQAGGGDRASV